MPQFLISGGDDCATTLLLAHGAGAGMETPFLEYFASSLPEQGVRVARFELTDVRRSPESELGKKQLHHLLGREIERLPSLMRTVLLLRDVKEIPIPEVARTIGISISAAKSRLSRARQELRSRLERHYLTTTFSTTALSASSVTRTAIVSSAVVLSTLST